MLTPLQSVHRLEQKRYVLMRLQTITIPFWVYFSVEIRQLRLKLAEKQDYISDLQDELQQLTERITEMDQDHVKHIGM